MAYRQWVNPFVLNYETIQDWLYEAEFTRRRQKDYLLSTKVTFQLITEAIIRPCRIWIYITFGFDGYKA